MLFRACDPGDAVIPSTSPSIQKLPTTQKGRALTRGPALDNHADRRDDWLRQTWDSRSSANRSAVRLRELRLPFQRQCPPIGLAHHDGGVAAVTRGVPGGGEPTELSFERVRGLSD